MKNSIDVKEIREELKMSQAAFASSLRISLKTLHKWEQNISQPSAAAKSLLCLVREHPELVIKTLKAQA